MDKNINDIKIERYRCPDVVVVSVSLDEVVGIVYDVSTENEQCQPLIDHHGDFVKRKEDLQSKKTVKKTKQTRKEKRKSMLLCCCTWMMPKAVRPIRQPNKKGPRK